MSNFVDYGGNTYPFLGEDGGMEWGEGRVGGEEGVDIGIVRKMSKACIKKLIIKKGGKR